MAFETNTTIAVDTETTGTDFFHGCRPFLITICDGDYNYHWEGQVNPWTREVFWEPEDIENVQKILDSAHTIIFHNSFFDVRALESIGIRWTEFHWNKIRDTLIMSHALCSGDSHGLKDLAVKYLQYWDDDEDELEEAVKAARQNNPDQRAKKGHPHFPGIRTGKFWKMDFWMAREQCLRYAYGDVERTFLLYEVFKIAISTYNFTDLVAKRTYLVRILFKMQSYGLYFDVASAQKWIQKATKRKQEIVKEISAIAGIKYQLDLRKKNHLKALLFERLKLQSFIETKTGPSTSKLALELIESINSDLPVVKLLKEWRKIDKRQDYIQSYVAWCDADNVIHSSLNPCGTRETRQSSSGPNQQNIDKFLRQYFVVPQGYVRISVDLVNIELRIWAYETGNKELIDAFESGKSVHLIIYETLFPEDVNECKMLLGDHWADEIKDGKYAKRYTSVKGGTFSRIYGATDKKSNQTYGRADACAMIDRRFPEIGAYMKSISRSVHNNIQEHGPCVFTLGGYRLCVNLEQMYAATNYRIQGTAGLMMTEMMIALHRHEWAWKRWFLAAQVHDSIDADIPRRYANQQTYDTFLGLMKQAGLPFIPTVDVSYKIIQ